MTKKGNMNAVVCALAVALLATGCGHRRWGMCALGGGLLGATAGGVGAGVIRYNSQDHGVASDRTTAAASAIGAATGGIIGALLGHYICDPIDEPVAQAAPPVEPPPAPGTEIVELRGTHFAFDSARLTPEGEAILDQAIATLEKHPQINVRIEGHTDSIGSEAYNMKLGQRRADAVESYLVSHGISASRLSTVSYGESRPVASNDTEEGRAQNRRTELIVQ
ncbi:MAG TPA: OmpA family protein [Candidatus Limnocylindria bacterium]|nr:OmpA family protein [Candidatus Limnocylindria bacterium]